MIVHIAGPAITVGDQQRQRCAWCGAVLIDFRFSLAMVPVGQPGPPPTWPGGDLVARDGNASWIVEHKDGDPLPAEACARLDPAVTR